MRGLKALVVKRLQGTIDRADFSTHTRLIDEREL